VSEQNLQKPDGRVARRRGAAFVLLKSPPSTANDPPGFFLRELQSLANSPDMGRVGGSQRLKRFIRRYKIATGMDRIAVVIRIPTRDIDDA